MRPTHGHLATRLPLPIAWYTPAPDNRYNGNRNARRALLQPSGEIRTFKTVSSTLADSLDRYFNPFLALPDPPRAPPSPPTRRLGRDFTDNPPRFNSLYHYLRAQKVNATLITMFNSSAAPLCPSLPFSSVCRLSRFAHIPIRNIFNG